MNGNSYVLYIQTPLKNVSKVELVAATIPNTVYNITGGSNLFTVGSSNCSLAGGFYSSSSLVTAVNVSTGGEPRCVFLSNEGKFMFYSNVTSFNLVVNSQDFSLITGFSLGATASQVASPATGVYSPVYQGVNFVKSTSVANFKTCGEYIYLDIDELRRPFQIDAVSNVYKSQSSTIFAVIPLDVSSGCIKTFKEHTDYKISVEYPKPIDSIDRLTVNWRDYSGNIIQFNGVDENSLILRFFEEAPSSMVEYVPPTIPQFHTAPDKKTVFVMLIVSLVFILFIKFR
jgi:hypothetical protein